jgi:hypothetical protein
MIDINQNIPNKWRIIGDIFLKLPKVVAVKHFA